MEIKWYDFFIVGIMVLLVSILDKTKLPNLIHDVTLYQTLFISYMLINRLK
jgi:hypothetical protein